MRRVKFSHYNELIPIENKEGFLLYNILTGRLNILQSQFGNIVRSISQLTSFSMDDFPEFGRELTGLFDQGFFVEEGFDEISAYQNGYSEIQRKKFSDNAHIGLTIGTTITCNMGCPYCFEVVKPNKSLRDEKVVLAMAEYIENMIIQAPAKHWSSLSITWYGGEPLINKEAIRVLSDQFLPLCEKYHIPFDASIITNGVLLSKENWDFLKDCRVENVQITIDGDKETHESYRPLKNPNGKNYEKILENLAMMPSGMQANIRINTDKKVFKSLPRLLSDLRSYGIWPQRHSEVSIKLAWLRAYKDADISAMSFFTQEEFFGAEHEFSCMLTERYNEWAGSSDKPLAKLKWKFPEKQSDCATYVSPYFFTIDPEGNIHKCWETVHDSSISSGRTVFDDWKASDFKRYLDYSRTDVHPVCHSCKYNPVCEGLSCAYDTLHSLEEHRFPCTPWKTQLPAYFSKMYGLMAEDPDKVAFAASKGKAHQTHANK